MKYCFDLDNTLCTTYGNNYSLSTPNIDMITKVNHLYDNDNYIIIYTARGMTTFQGDIHKVYNKYFELTKLQLEKWGIKYHQLFLGKPSFDVFIDDKNQNISDFKRNVLPVNGFIAGSFDLIHPGYIKMFKESKEKCDRLIVGLHEDPSIERGKSKPILSVDDRMETLKSIKYIDEVLIYKTEKDLIDTLIKLKPDILFLGDDYLNKDHNGKKLNIKTHYINRYHGWSSTLLKNKIKNNK